MEEKRIKSCVYVTCIIDGTKYENVLEQELINMGLLELRYSKTIDRKLTYEDYINHNYKGYLHFTANYGEIIDDKVIVTQYKNVYIPTIYERNDEFVKKYKNK